jgi:hypothetical protein
VVKKVVVFQQGKNFLYLSLFLQYCLPSSRYISSLFEYTWDHVGLQAAHNSIPFSIAFGSRHVQIFLSHVHVDVDLGRQPLQSLSLSKLKLNFFLLFSSFHLHRVPRKDLTPEMRHSLGKSLYTDYLSSPSLDEAVGSAQELETPGFAPTLVQIGLEKAFEILGDKEQLSLVDLIAALSARGIFTGEDLRDGVGALTAGLDDIALDVPSAPRLLGRLLGSAVAGGLLGLNEVASQVKSVESAEPRRMFVAAALHAVKENAGEDALKEYCEEAKIDMNALLAADPEFDPPELPDVPIFLKAEGLEAALV